MRKEDSYEQKQREIPGEIVRRNVRQVIDILSNKGIQHLQALVNQYLNGEKSQYEFLLPKSKYHCYYTQELTDAELQGKRERKYNQFEKSNIEQLDNNFSHNQNGSQKTQIETILVVGTVEQVSVGAMCELIKELRQNQQSPYQSLPNQVYEQELTIDLNNPELEKKIQPILDIIQSLKNPQKMSPTVQTVQKSATNKIDFLRGELGTEKDGSLGSWGGKKYQGLGMRDQFSTYRKQVSKTFYQSMPR